jgi:voltage-gated potassium channel Kch
MHLRGVANHRGLAWLLVAWLSTMAITSAFVYLAENGVNKLMASPFDALWWGVTTLTTVGYGDTYPVTPEGRLAAMVLMLLGITLFAGITASITSYFVTQGQGGGGAHSSIAEELRGLADLRSDGALTEDEFTAAKIAILRGGLP